MNRTFQKTLSLASVARKETFRNQSQLVTVLMVVCGISVPLALLAGLADGLILQQQNDIQKISTVRVIGISATPASGPLNQSVEQELLAAHPEIQAVIPDVIKVGDLRNVVGTGTASGVTLRATQAADPELAFYGVDVLRAGQPGIVLSRHLAESLNVSSTPGLRARTRHVDPGQSVVLTIYRDEGATNGSQELRLPVAAVAEFGTSTAVAYLHRDLLDTLDAYQQGQSVLEFGWPGCPRPVPPRFEAYLAFSKVPFSALDELKLRAHGLRAAALEPLDANDEPLRTLSGTLSSHTLFVYRIFAEGADRTGSERPLLSRPAVEIEEITEVDDVVFPWSTPLDLEIDGASRPIVGITGEARWLARLFPTRAAPFGVDEPEFQVRPTDGSAPTEGRSSVLRLGDGKQVALRAGRSPATDAVPRPVEEPSTLPLDWNGWSDFLDTWAGPLFPLLPEFCRTHAAGGSDKGRPMTLFPILPDLGRVHAAGGGGHGRPRSRFPLLSDRRQIHVAPDPSEIDQTPRVAVVPAALLAHMRAFQRAELVFDPPTGQFVDPAPPTRFYQARVVVRDIDSVPAADALLAQRGFAPQSQRTRVEELQRYAATLQLIVGIVGGTVFAFGFWTLCAVLGDNTLRKRRMIGALRQMGVGRAGVTYVVLLRGILIGLTAAAVTAPLAWGLARLVTIHIAPCEVGAEHLIVVSGLALAACFAGTLWPAGVALVSSPKDVLDSGNRY